jgi:hypothetical protein
MSLLCATGVMHETEETQTFLAPSLILCFLS